MEAKNGEVTGRLQVSLCSHTSPVHGNHRQHTDKLTLRSSAGANRAGAPAVSSLGLRLHGVTSLKKKKNFLSEKDLFNLHFLQSILKLVLEAGTFPSFQTKTFIWGGFPLFFYFCRKTAAFHAKKPFLPVACLPALTFHHP